MLSSRCSRFPARCRSFTSRRSQSSRVRLADARRPIADRNIGRSVANQYEFWKLAELQGRASLSGPPFQPEAFAFGHAGSAAWLEWRDETAANFHGHLVTGDVVADVTVAMILASDSVAVAVKYSAFVMAGILAASIGIVDELVLRVCRQTMIAHFGRCSFSLRTLFVVVGLVCCWMGV